MHKQDSINTSLQNQLNQLLNCCKNNEGHSSSSHSNNSEQHYKTDGTTTIEPTNVELNNAQAIVLDQNNPNPFKESTTITYFIPDDVQNVKIVFYDNMGKIIKAMEVHEKGNGILQVYASNLSSGIYTYSIIARCTKDCTLSSIINNINNFSPFITFVSDS